MNSQKKATKCPKMKYKEALIIIALKWAAQRLENLMSQAEFNLVCALLIDLIFMFSLKLLFICLVLEAFSFEVSDGYWN